ncbi:MAG TPA: phosphate ABC transporter ATP-binding protein [Candidatus Caldiarchaeum subterraneum]|uniref:Phosphate ABC transporter ATP-binding protein n=1 Tax=Caldiarchaeum subterraneum TaxID=311458 RepID=A0A832ZWM4_CALS0|nr:phosphate ABC transporter ATP-binding protein [Candidatus Caldarchaeum subterraneum]
MTSKIEEIDTYYNIGYVITTLDLSVKYGGRYAIKDININIPRNSITAIIGPSGSGKTTFLRCLNRMNDLISKAKVEGRVLFNGKNIYDPDVDPYQIRARIGMVFQKPNPFPKSIFENVAFGLRINGVKNREEIERRVKHALTQAALWDEVKDRLNHNAYELSGGQQQRLCIARALAVEPEVLLMDEPAASLDPIATARIEELMIRLKERYTIIIVTHNMQQAARVADYTAVMMPDEDGVGKLVEFGTTREIFTNPKSKKTEDYVRGRIG